MTSEEVIRSKLSFQSLFLRLWPFLKTQPGRLALALILVGLYVAVGRALPLLFGYAIDHGFQKNNLLLIRQIAAVYLVLQLARAGLSYWQNAEILIMGNAVLHDIRDKLILHLQRLPMSYFDRNASGRIMTRVTTDIANLGELFTDGFTAFFISLIEMVSVIVALAAISWRLTGLSLAIVPLSLYASARISLQIRDRLGKAKRTLATLNASAAETIAGLRVVHLFDRKQLRQEKFQALSTEYKNYQLQTVRMYAALWPVVEAFNMITVGSALLFGGLYHQQLELSLGQLSAFVLLIQSFFSPLRMILERYNQLQNSLTSADRVFDMFQEPTEPLGTPSLQAPRLRGEIEYRHLSFRFAPQAPQALQGVSLHIRAGERVAFVGRTGAGKTTMISLLQKFYPLQDGDLLVDGKSVRAYATQDLRARFGVVLQETFLFHGTLRANVTLHRRDIGDGRVLRALADVGLEDLIARRGQGLDFLIEERGANLSFGERQLVAFARLLAFDPDILILDEATANIDSISEQKIQNAIAEVTRGRTSLIIAHRLSTVLTCDKIVVMEQGRILEVGNHAQLLALRGRYAELYKTQQQPSSSPVF